MKNEQMLDLDLKVSNVGQSNSGTINPLDWNYTRGAECIPSSGSSGGAYTLPTGIYNPK